MVVHAFNPRRQKQVDPCEFQASLVSRYLDADWKLKRSFLSPKCGKHGPTVVSKFALTQGASKTKHLFTQP